MSTPYETTLAAQALDALGHLYAVWHNRFSNSELDAIGTVRDALWREVERQPSRSDSHPGPQDIGNGEDHGEVER